MLFLSYIQTTPHLSTIYRLADLIASLHISICTTPTYTRFLTNMPLTIKVKSQQIPETQEGSSIVTTKPQKNLHCQLPGFWAQLSSGFLPNQVLVNKIQTEFLTKPVQVRLQPGWIKKTVRKLVESKITVLLHRVGLGQVQTGSKKTPGINRSKLAG